MGELTVGQEVPFRAGVVIYFFDVARLQVNFFHIYTKPFHFSVSLVYVILASIVFQNGFAEYTNSAISKTQGQSHFFGRGCDSKEMNSHDGLQKTKHDSDPRRNFLTEGKLLHLVSN